MAPTALKLMTHHWRSRRSSSEGFTLIELLVVIFIAGGIVSGLTYLAVELLTTDRRESVRTETQRDIQLALDYIGAELKEAIYVYPDVQGPEIAPSLPDDFTPVLAFWKQQVLPEPIRESCAADGSFDAPCLRGHSYTLVVYSLSTEDEENWDGRARIVRSAMTQFDNDGNRNGGYVSPVDVRNVDFANWPYERTPEYNQVEPLSDFIDDGQGALAINQVPSGLCPVITATPPAVAPEYSVTPGAAGFRSFYACVSEPAAGVGPESWNQEVIVYLQGNADGRSGIYEEGGFLPTIETRVLSRGIIDKNLATAATP